MADEVVLREQRVCQFCRQVKPVRTANMGGQVKNPAICDEDAAKQNLKWVEVNGRAKGWQ